MKHYSVALKLTLLVNIILLIGATIAFIVRNNKREEVLEPQMREVIEQCEMDGLKNCEAVRVYDGTTMVKFYVRGTREEETK